MWEISLSLQIEAFLWSLVLGAIICFAFDLMTFTEEFLKAPKTVFYILDILFFLAVGILDFCFFLVFFGGDIRGFVFLGEIVGFYLCKKTAARIYGPFLMLVYGMAERLVKSGYSHIVEPILSFFAKICKKSLNFGQKSLFFIKKCLKKPKRLVYTKEKCPKATKKKKG